MTNNWRDTMSRGSRKIAVIGAGNVGATCAFVLANMKIADVVLLDIYEGFAKGKALDMSQNANVLNYNGTITGTSNYEDIAGADVVVVTSGFPRQPGMTREDLIGKNAEIVAQVGAGIRDHAPDSVVIVVTNPLDLMTYHMQKVTGFPANRVIGQEILTRMRSRGKMGKQLVHVPIDAEDATSIGSEFALAIRRLP